MIDVIVYGWALMTCFVMVTKSKDVVNFSYHHFCVEYDETGDVFLRTETRYTKKKSWPDTFYDDGFFFVNITTM